MDGIQSMELDPSLMNGSIPSGKRFPFTNTDSTPQYLAFLVTAGFFGLLYLLCFKSAPDSNLAMMNIVVGSLGTAWVGVMAYYFGSTHAGRTKDQMLYQSQPVSPPK